MCHVHCAVYWFQMPRCKSWFLFDNCMDALVASTKLGAFLRCCIVWANFYRFRFVFSASGDWCVCVSVCVCECVLVACCNQLCSSQPLNDESKCLIFCACDDWHHLFIHSIHLANARGWGHIEISKNNDNSKVLHLSFTNTPSASAYSRQMNQFFFSQFVVHSSVWDFSSFVRSQIDFICVCLESTGTHYSVSREWKRVRKR